MKITVNGTIKLRMTSTCICHVCPIKGVMDAIISWNVVYKIYSVNKAQKIIHRINGETRQKRNTSILLLLTISVVNYHRKKNIWALNMTAELSRILCLCDKKYQAVLTFCRGKERWWYFLISRNEHLFFMQITRAFAPNN